MIDGVLLIAFGGPTAPAEIRPFLENVSRGRSIPAARLDEVARHYAQMPGSRSPLTDLTLALARALERTLAAAELRVAVDIGMRNWHPFIHETLEALAARGVRRAVGIILSPLRTDASWDRYRNDVAAARARVPKAPEIVFAPAWFDHPGFIEAVADRTRNALAGIPEGARASTPLVFTAHSVPRAMADASPYVTDFATAARAVAGKLGHRRVVLAYQSRSGDPRDAWLEPDVNAALKDLADDGARAVVVVPIGFVSDHVEVLYDLDVEARATASALGLGFHRAAAVNDHPALIGALADLVARAARAPA
jgi:protoporphyrin/coproporphyrin ferrochelatase